MNDCFRKHHGPRQSWGIDGPFSETKELVGGYWLWQVKSIDVAVEWLKRAPFDQERKWNGKPSKKGTGFEQPPQPHQHWHIDISYLNVCATFYYDLCSILDGYSRFLVHWDLRESMTEADIEIIWNELKSDTPGLNEDQFRQRAAGMTHVRTSSEQRHRIHHAEGYASRTPAGDSGRAGSEVGGCRGNSGRIAASRLHDG